MDWVILLASGASAVPNAKPMWKQVIVLQACNILIQFNELFSAPKYCLYVLRDLWQFQLTVWCLSGLIGLMSAAAAVLVLMESSARRKGPAKWWHSPVTAARSVARHIIKSHVKIVNLHALINLENGDVNKWNINVWMKSTSLLLWRTVGKHVVKNLRRMMGRID